MMRELGALAVAQLRAWETYARRWPLRIEPKENGLHLVCAVCEMTLLPVSCQARPYTFDGHTTLAATVAHLRNGIHGWVEEEVYSNGDGSGGQNAQAHFGAGDSGSGHVRSVGSD